MALLQATAPSATAPRQPGGSTSAPAQTAAQVKPFCQASKVGHRLVGNFAPGVSAAPAAIGPTALNASGGFVKRWILETQMTGGGGTTPGVFGADGPWDYFSLVTLTEPNNNPILNLTGYNLFLADIYGGYTLGENPANDPDYSTTLGNAQMWPYIPVELDPTALGALSDLSSASGYQLYLLPNPTASVYTTLPVPLPTANVNVEAEFWTLPDQTDADNTPQAIVPPRAGTIQMWNQILNIVLSAGGGNQEYQLNRMGNRLRTVLMVTRSSGARADAVFPNPARVEWDDILLKNMSPQIFRKLAFEKVLSQAARPPGVFPLFFNEGISRYVGGNGTNSWLSTVVDTRFALSGNFAAATAPTLDYVVNDVSFAPLGAVQRTTVGPSGPGYHPGSTVGSSM